jgi:hypothetical protein
MAATLLMVMATATMTIGKGNDDDGKGDDDGKDNDGSGGGIPDPHTTINYMTAAEDMAAATAGNSVKDKDGDNRDENDGNDNSIDGEDDNMMATMTTAVVAAYLPNMQQSTT